MELTIVDEENIQGDELEYIALKELMAEHPDIFLPMNTTQKSLLLKRQSDIIMNRVIPSSHKRLGKILYYVKQNELWRFDPEGFSQFKEWLASLRIPQALASQVMSWTECVFPKFEELGIDIDNTMNANLTNLKTITPHVSMLTTGEPSKSQQVVYEVEKVLERTNGDKDEAIRFLVDQATIQPTRALRQVLTMGEEADTVTVHFSRSSMDGWRVWMDVDTIQRDMVFRRLSDMAEFVRENSETSD